MVSYYSKVNSGQQGEVLQSFARGKLRRLVNNGLETHCPEALTVTQEQCLHSTFEQYTASTVSHKTFYRLYRMTSSGLDPLPSLTVSVSQIVNIPKLSKAWSPSFDLSLSEVLPHKEKDHCQESLTQWHECSA